MWTSRSYVIRWTNSCRRLGQIGSDNGTFSKKILSDGSRSVPCDLSHTELSMTDFWAFQNLLKCVFALVEDLLVISESIYYFGFRLYAGAFVVFHHISSFLH